MSAQKIIGSVVIILVLIFVGMILFFLTQTQQEPFVPEDPKNQTTTAPKTDVQGEGAPGTTGETIENSLGEHGDIESVEVQQKLAREVYTIFEAHCKDCHGEYGSYADVLVIQHKALIETEIVIPGKPDDSEFYLRLLGDTDNGSQMPLGQDPLDSGTINTIRRWIEVGASDWEAIPKPKRHFISTEAMLQIIHTHVESLTKFDRSFARYFTLTHLYNAGASDDNLRAYRNALSKLVNSLSWGSEVIKPEPIDMEETIFYVDLRHYEWDIKSDKWYKIEQAYPYGVQLKSSTYATLCQETDCELPFVRADWFIAAASLPPLYHEILNLPKTDRELETRLEVNFAENLKNAPGVRVWRAGFNNSGVSVNNRIVERHKSRYGAYWKSYDFAGNVGTQNIFTHPLDFTHDGGEIIFNLPNGLQAYYLTTATGERLDEAPINIVSDAGARDPVVRNGLSCMGCHTEGMKAFDDQIRSVIEQNPNPLYDRSQALRLYAEKSEMNTLIREDTERYRRALEDAGGIFGGSEPIQQLIKQFRGPLKVDYAAAEVGMETDEFLKKIRGNSTLQNAGLLVFSVEEGTFKRDAWESQFEMLISELRLGSTKTQPVFLNKAPGLNEPNIPVENEWVFPSSKGEGERSSVIPPLAEVDPDSPLSKDKSKPSLLNPELLEKNAGVVHPQYKFKVEPKYPEVASRAGKEGQVVLQATIDENGIPRDIVALTDIGFGLEEAAIAALKGTTFRPVIRGGKPINLQVEIPYSFTLRDVYLTDMVLIPAGEFQMGSNSGHSNEKPVHPIYVDDFYIDKYEVTNAQYKDFIDGSPRWRKDRILDKYHDGNYLKHWNGNNYPTGKGEYPVNYVSWYAAIAYAEWMGKRLPTEAEWEKAARGGLRNKTYPWGNFVDSSKANYDRHVGKRTVVGMYPANGYGLHDMAGNVREWCLDEYVSSFYMNAPRQNPVAGVSNIRNITNNFAINNRMPRVCRGGSWDDSSKGVRNSHRFGSTPTRTSVFIGFRCVK